MQNVQTDDCIKMSTTPANNSSTASPLITLRNTRSAPLTPNGRTTPASSPSTPSTPTEVAEVVATPQDEIDLFALVIKFGTYFCTFFFGYLVGFTGLSIVWISIAAFLLVIRDRNRAINEHRVEFHRSVAENESKFIKSAVDALPSWVHFPDTERAEWINKILKQLWPFLSEYISGLLKGQIEQNINEMMPDYLKGLRFENIDFGSMHPRLGSVKCYDENTARDEIILDLELIYAGNCDIRIRVKGLNVGVRDFQLYGILRVELKPLIKDSPLIGCVSAYFLQNPIVEMNFANFAEILDFPGLSDLLRRAIKEQIARFVVLPNKFVFPLVENFNTSLIKLTVPIGVLRLEIIEAKKLKKADLGVLGMGKSDPYVVVSVGNREFRTQTISNTVNPRWNYCCDAPIFFNTQSIDLDVMDEDQGSKDDFLGRASISYETIQNDGIIDAWINLNDTKTGKIHIKATWMSLEATTEPLQAQQRESRELKAKYAEIASKKHPPHFGSVACVQVYLDNATNLPISSRSISDPSPQVSISLHKHTFKSTVKNFTTSPIWEENFLFLLDEYNSTDEVTFKIVDTLNSRLIGERAIKLSALKDMFKMTSKEPLMIRQYSHNFDLHATISLRFLKTSMVEHIKILRDDTFDSEECDNIPTMEDMIKGTVEPFARMSGIDTDIIQMSQDRRTKFKNGRATEIQEESMDLDEDGLVDASPGTFPMIEVSVRNLAEENLFEMIIHRAINLKALNNKPPDSYVKVSTSFADRIKFHKEKKHKSQVIKSSCDPTYNERIHYDHNDAIESVKLEVYSPHKFGKSRKQTLGYVEIFFNDNNNAQKNLSFTKWYELEQTDD